MFHLHTAPQVVSCKDILLHRNICTIRYRKCSHEKVQCHSCCKTPLPIFSDSHIRWFSKPSSCHWNHKGSSQRIAVPTASHSQRDTQACFLSLHYQTIWWAPFLSFSGFSSKEQSEIYLSTVFLLSSAEVARSAFFSRESFKSFPSLSHEEIVTPNLLAKQLL